jgi:2-amino-4-hydroxy-6-hydroxymethyldihydropteridine diphosphokinase
MYEIDQAKFLNAIVVFTSKLDASELLDVFKVTEAEIGRKKRLANGPREIDLDLVWIDGYQSPLGAVPIVPHPRAHERKFVLEPLNEILPGIVLQGYGKVERLLMSEDLQGQSVDKVEDASILLSSG